MKQLILLRHAEAQPQRAGLTDFDRTLSDVGRTEALDAGDCLRDEAVRIDALFASPARRAKETALIVAARLDFNRELQYEQLLYQGGPELLLQPLQQCHAAVETVLIVGHNPSLSALARQLASSQPTVAATSGRGHAASERRLELRTAGACRFVIQSDSWSNLQPQAVTSMTWLR